MLHQFIKGKVYIFIDAENLFYAQRTLGWRISYDKLINYFKKECSDGIKCFVYSGKDENNKKQLKFFDMLEINNYIVRTKIIKKLNHKKENINGKVISILNLPLRWLRRKKNTILRF